MGVYKSYYKYVNIFFNEEHEHRAVKEVERYLSLGYEVVIGVDEAEFISTDDGGNIFCSQVVKISVPESTANVF